jgi:hypothetical protein
MDPKHALEEISKNYDDLTWWYRTVLQRYVVAPIINQIYNTGDNYLEKDWDNLIIFDACRADMFEEEFDTSVFDDYEVAKSTGSTSVEWMNECFGEGEWNDIVYISANPWVSKVRTDAFHETINLMVENHNLTEDAEPGDLSREHHKDGLGTISAQELTEVAIKKFKEYPNKRFILHYFQPHSPCIGRRDGSIRDDLDSDPCVNEDSTLDDEWKAYKENLRYVYHHSQDFVEVAEGKTVYTADHGELFGDLLWPIPIKGYKHPKGLHHPKLINVPWATETTGERRKIKNGDVSEHKYDKEKIDDKLEDLGYKV